MTKVQVAQARIDRLNILVAMVDGKFIGKEGDIIIRKLAPFYPHLPAMLVSVTERGFSAHAHFQSHRLLALLQLEELTFEQINLDKPPEVELPF